MAIAFRKSLQVVSELLLCGAGKLHDMGLGLDENIRDLRRRDCELQKVSSH
jgi:hypothetical protein